MGGLMKRPKPPVVREDKLGMTEEEVKDLFAKEMWKEFSKWMVGQTCTMWKGKFAYYDHDVKRFVEMKLRGKPTYFD
jgi:hypothetical protein